jgi:hypothetical protein
VHKQEAERQTIAAMRSALYEACNETGPEAQDPAVPSAEGEAPAPKKRKTERDIVERDIVDPDQQAVCSHAHVEQLVSLKPLGTTKHGKALSTTFFGGQSCAECKAPLALLEHRSIRSVDSSGLQSFAASYAMRRVEQVPSGPTVVGSTQAPMVQRGNSKALETAQLLRAELELLELPQLVELLDQLIVELQ